MKNFYIFLDIDGVMYDWDFIIAEVKAGRMVKGALIDRFKPESIKALNFLIKELEAVFDVKLVISSTWRSNLPYTIQVLKDNGLIYNKEIGMTPIYNPAKRGEQILDYLSDKNNYEFVIIDDEMFDFDKFFKKNKIIKCEMFHSALSMKMVNNFLIRLDESKNHIAKQN